MARSDATALERARLVAGLEEESGPSREARAKSSEFDLSLYLGSFGEKIKELCYYAGLDSIQIRRVATYFLVCLALILLPVVLLRSVSILLAIVPVTFLFHSSLKRKALQRIRKFDSDYPALLISLASSVRSGLDPLVALIQSEGIFANDSEVRKAIAAFRLEIDSGASEEKAIESFAASVNHPDLQLFRAAFLLARREGSSLGECLHRLARVTRQRQSFRRKVRAAVAMQKLSAFGIAGCTVAIGLIQYTTNPTALVEAFNHPAGFKILLFGLGLILFGLGWMVRMTRSRV